MSDLNPAGLEAAAKALSEKLHWLADDERARELAQSSVRAYLSASLPSDAEKNPYRQFALADPDDGDYPAQIQAWDEGYAAGLHEENAYPQAWRYGAAEERERWQAMNALLSDQLEEVRRWHLAAVKEKRAAQADAERLFTALDGYIMARITGTDLRDYDDLAERAVRAHRSLAAADREKPDECRAPHCWSEYGTPCGDCPTLASARKDAGSASNPGDGDHAASPDERDGER